MSSEKQPASEVLIAGAGPTGLSLAITLCRFGVRPRVIDRAPHPSQVSKALAIWSGSLEAFDAMGAIDAFLSEGTRLHSLIAGDGSRQLGSLTVGEGIDSPYPFPLLLPQSRTEVILARRLVELGGTIERNVEMTALDQDHDGVTAILRHADGRSESARAKYLIGCDGARSLVRQTLGIEFEGYTEPQTFLLCDARIEGALDPASIYVWWRGGGTIALFPIQDGVWRMFAMRDGGSTEDQPTLGEMQHQLDAHGPGGLRLGDASWLSLFRVNERLASRYRGERCFLAGDAAHIHSPAGGQGMNTGIQDAFNLGWKLAYVLNHIGDSGLLLDSYESERRPIARDVVEGAAQKLHFAFGGGVVRALRDIAIPIISRIPVLQKKLQVELSETEIVYRGGPLVDLAGGHGSGAAAVGSRARDATILDPDSGRASNLWPLLSGPRHTLLRFDDSPSRRDEFPTVDGRLRVVSIGRETSDTNIHQRYGMDTPGWILVRPDQVIAARGQAGDTATLDRYIARVLKSTGHD